MQIKGRVFTFPNREEEEKEKVCSGEMTRQGPGNDAILCFFALDKLASFPGRRRRQRSRQGRGIKQPDPDATPCQGQARHGGWSVWEVMWASGKPRRGENGESRQHAAYQDPVRDETPGSDDIIVAEQGQGDHVFQEGTDGVWPATCFGPLLLFSPMRESGTRNGTAPGSR